MKTFSVFLMMACLAVSCREVFFSPEPHNNPEAIFDYFWQDFNENYAVFEERKVNWDSVYTVLRPQVTARTTDDQLFSLLSEAIRPLNDGHVRLIAPDKTIYSSNEYFRELKDDHLFSQQIIQSNYLQNKVYTDADSSYFYGLINDEIAYLYLPYIAGNFAIINRVIDEYGDKKGLIVDLRHNSGGDFTFAFADFGRFTQEKRHVFTSRTKNGPGKNDYTSPFAWFIAPAGTYYDKKIVLLTDRFTISAGERTAMAFMVLPNVVSVGDTTNGAHATMVGRDLANGWYYSLATQKIYFTDGSSYEGRGLAPRIYMQNTEDDLLAGRDKVLEKAIEQF